MFARDNFMNLYSPNTYPSKGLNMNVHKKVNNPGTNKQQQ